MSPSLFTSSFFWPLFLSLSLSLCLLSFFLNLRLSITSLVFSVQDSKTNLLWFTFVKALFPPTVCFHTSIWQRGLFGVKTESVCASVSVRVRVWECACVACLNRHSEVYQSSRTGSLRIGLSYVINTCAFPSVTATVNNDVHYYFVQSSSGLIGLAGNQSFFIFISLQKVISWYFSVWECPDQIIISSADIQQFQWRKIVKM